MPWLYRIAGLTFPHAFRWRMTVTGTERKYLVPQVEPGKAYRYTVQVDVTRDGRTLSATAEPRIAAGAEVNLVFQEAVDRPQVVTTRD